MCAQYWYWVSIESCHNIGFAGSLIHFQVGTNWILNFQIWKSLSSLLELYSVLAQQICPYMVIISVRTEDVVVNKILGILCYLILYNGCFNWALYPTNYGPQCCWGNSPSITTTLCPLYYTATGMITTIILLKILPVIWQFSLPLYS